jgi:hypothetical protein
MRPRDGARASAERAHRDADADPERAARRAARHARRAADPEQARRHEERRRREPALVAEVDGTGDYVTMAPRPSPVPMQGMTAIVDSFDAYPPAKSAEELQRERDRELQALQSRIQRPPPEALAVIRERADDTGVAGRVAQFRERQDQEWGNSDFGPPPPQAINCGIGNSRLPPGPTAEDMSKWRVSELHEMIEMQRAVAEGARTQDYYY